EMIGFEQVAKLIERQVIEIAPLAYMRGRTLNNSYIILDESQNTTPEQMKMFLTRIGFGSTAVITGDITQVDLPRGQRSGLSQVLDVLKETPGIGVTHFAAKDVVRHPLVQRIIEAYDEFESQQEVQERARREARQQEREARMQALERAGEAPR
ncbi:MAG: PhoH family protein, partial [Vreelandella alkaliphila]